VDLVVKAALPGLAVGAGPDWVAGSDPRVLGLALDVFPSHGRHR
jgi:hypothetical protein